MRILVVGAGIAGLAAARALTRAGQAVEVVERAAGPDRGGAGIYLPGNAVRALRRVGLDELAASRSGPSGSSTTAAGRSPKST